MRPFSKYRYYIIALAVSAIWLLLIILPPILLDFSYKKSSFFLYFIFSPLCHQKVERSFLLGGYPLAVCSRCFGIYCGLFLGFLLFPFIRRFNYQEVIDGRYLIAGCLPMIMDVAFMALGIYPSNRWTRLTTGLSFGTILAFFALPGFFQMFYLIFRRSWIKNLLKYGGGIISES